MTKTIPRIALFLAFSAAILVITTRPSSADEPPAAAPAAAARGRPRSCTGRPRCSRADERRAHGASRRRRGVRHQQPAEGADAGHDVWSRPQRLDDDLGRAGALHDAAGPGAVLRRSGAPQERAVGPGAVPRLRRHGHLPVVAGRLQLRVRASGTRASSAGTTFAFLQGRRLRAQRRLRATGCRRTSSRCTS